MRFPAAVTAVVLRINITMCDACICGVLVFALLKGVGVGCCMRYPAYPIYYLCDELCEEVV